MAKGREKSDGRTVPEALRKQGQTAAVEQRGGKATTANEQAKQLEMFGETADSPQGADGGADEGQPLPAPHAVPKSRNKTRDAVPAMTMEAVANKENLRRAFRQVASNRGAPGPDRQSIDEVRLHLDDVLSVLRSELLDGSYRPGQIRRVWIPKSNGGQRGLGIPNVIDRIAQQGKPLTRSVMAVNAIESRLSGRCRRQADSKPRQRKRSAYWGRFWAGCSAAQRCGMSSERRCMGQPASILPMTSTR